MFTQLNPPLPVDVADRGPGQAIAVIDYGPEHHLIWVTALDDSGQIWCAPNPRVRVQANWTMGRTSEFGAAKAASLKTPSLKTPSLKTADACACHAPTVADLP